MQTSSLEARQSTVAMHIQVTLGYLESYLGALEVVEAATVGGETTATATTSTTSAAATAVAEATTATTTAATSTEATAASATATTVTAAVVVTGRSEVDADVAAINVLSAQTIKSSLGLLDVGELNVSETLGGTSLTVGGKRDTGNLAVLAESLTDGLVGRVEGEVSDEQSVAGSAALVTELLGAGGTLVLVLRAGLAEVDVQGTAVEVRVVKSLLGRLSSVGGCELNVTETKINVSKRQRIHQHVENTYPLERPDSRSVMMRQPSIVP